MSLDEHIDGIGDPSLPVKVVSGFDFSHAVLSAQEGFVLSRVDGRMTVETLCVGTGLGPNTTLEILRRLRAQGIIVVGDEAPVRTEVDATGGRLVGESVRGVPSAEAGGEGDDEDDADDRDDEEVDLKPEVRRQVRRMYRRLFEMSYFELLEVETAADARAIRRAYFKRSKQYHPDRYYTKRLGRYAEMLAEIFKQITAAYNYLENEDNRRSYPEAVAQGLLRPGQTPSSSAASQPSSAKAETIGGGGDGGDRAAPRSKAAGSREAAGQQISGTGEYTYSRARGLRQREVVQTGEHVKLSDEILEQASRRRTPAAGSTGLPPRQPQVTGPPRQPLSPRQQVTGPPRQPLPPRQQQVTGPRTPTSVAAPAARQQQVTGPRTPTSVAAPAARQQQVTGRQQQVTGPRTPTSVAAPAARQQQPTGPSLPAAEELRRRAGGRSRPPSGSLEDLAFEEASAPPTTITPRSQQLTGPALPVPESLDEHEVARREADRERSRRYRSRGTPVGACKQKAEQFFKEGVRQLEEGKALAAAGNLKLAMTFDSTVPEYRQRYEEALEQSRDTTADSLYKRALLEESVGRYEAAGKLFQRAADVLPKLEHLIKASEAALRAEDLIKAKEYATGAVQVAPGSVEARVVLGRVYLAAGLKRNARREVDEALKLEPVNASARSLLKEIKRL